MKKNRCTSIAGALFLLAANTASASTLVYTPSFSSPGSPYFYQSLSNQGSLSKHKDTSAGTDSTSQLIQNAVIYGISNRILTQLFAGSPDTGTIVLGDGRSITYYTTAGTRYVTIHDPVKGDTILSFPI